MSSIKIFKSFQAQRYNKYFYFSKNIFKKYTKYIQNKNCILRGRWVVTKSCKEMAMILVSTNPAPINDKIVGI